MGLERVVGENVSNYRDRLEASVKIRKAVPARSPHESTYDFSARLEASVKT